MAAIKLKHTSGNGTILHSPASNPTSDVTLKLPSTTGSAGQVLKVASANHSSTNAELEFGADTGGKILQVVTGTTTTSHTNTSTTYADTGLSATISISANSKVLVLVMQFCQLKRNTTLNRGALKLLRGSSDLLTTNGKFFGFNDTNVTNKNVSDVVNFMIVDTGASTGSNTYKTQSRVNVAADSAEFTTQDDGNPAHITLIEIGA